MNPNSLNLKLIIGITYLTIISIGVYFLFSVIDIEDLMSYEFIRLNRDIILEYKNENFLFLTVVFFVFSIVWVLLMGFAVPLLIFAPRRLKYLGFVFLVVFQFLIFITGNYTFFNVLTIALCILLLDDAFLSRFLPNNKTVSREKILFF